DGGASPSENSASLSAGTLCLPPGALGARGPFLEEGLIPEREQVANVFAVSRNFQVLHVGFQHFDLNSRQAEHGAVVVDQLPDEGGGAPQALCLLLDGGGLLGRKAERLSEVVVSRGRFGHRNSFPFACGAVLAPVQAQVKLKKNSS